MVINLFIFTCSIFIISRSFGFSSPNAPSPIRSIKPFITTTGVLNSCEEIAIKFSSILFNSISFWFTSFIIFNVFSRSSFDFSSSEYLARSLSISSFEYCLKYFTSESLSIFSIFPYKNSFILFGKFVSIGFGIYPSQPDAIALPLAPSPISAVIAIILTLLRDGMDLIFVVTSKPDKSGRLISIKIRSGKIFWAISIPSNPVLAS